jgi:hypothetical protein
MRNPKRGCAWPSVRRAMFIDDNAEPGSPSVRRAMC